MRYLIFLLIIGINSVYIDCYGMHTLLQSTDNYYYISRRNLVKYAQDVLKIKPNISLQWHEWNNLPDNLALKILNYYFVVQINKYQTLCCCPRARFGSLFSIVRSITNNREVPLTLPNSRVGKMDLRFKKRLIFSKELYQSLPLEMIAYILSFLTTELDSVVKKLHFRSYTIKELVYENAPAPITAYATINNRYLIMGNVQGNITQYDLKSKISKQLYQRHLPIKYIAANQRYLAYVMQYWQNKHWIIVNSFATHERITTYYNITNPHITLFRHWLAYSSYNAAVSQHCIYITNLKTKITKTIYLKPLKAPAPNSTLFIHLDNKTLFASSNDCLYFFNHRNFTRITNDKDYSIISKQIKPLEAPLLGNSHKLIVASKKRVEFWDKQQQECIFLLRHPISSANIVALIDESLLLANNNGSYLCSPAFNVKKVQSIITIPEQLALTLWL